MKQLFLIIALFSSAISLADNEPFGNITGEVIDE